MSNLMRSSFSTLVRWFLLAMLPMVITACGTTTAAKIKSTANETIDVISTKTNIGKNPRDPLEGFNRVMFDFNEVLDANVLKPAAEKYREIVPSFIQTGIGNFFSNIGDVWSAVNNLLQGRIKDSASDTMRVAINTTFGLGGLLDIGSQAGLNKHREDFGQTLGRWGVPSGPYLVLPLFGASTVRDSLVLPIDMKGDVWGYAYPMRLRNTGSAVRLLDKRADLLDAGSLLEEAALDKYVFIRDAYLQRRAGQVKQEDDD